MPIDVEKALLAELPPVRSQWDADDVILYHLGLGAGLSNPGDAGELSYTYEPCLKVLPTFAVIPSATAVPDLDVNAFPGIDIDLNAVLHGQQETIIHRPLEPAGDITSTASIVEIWDKGAAAVVVIEVRSEAGGEAWFTNRYALFVRGEGGFGGEKGPSSANGTPEREPDAVFESPTLANQALLYRLSGDKNPIHADPRIAKAAGLETPILHGLCTYGIVAKAIVDGMLDGDVTRMQSCQGRFAGVVLPGETIVTRVWSEPDHLAVDVWIKEREAPVLSNGRVVAR